jgi:hypothetical protein
MRRHVLFVVPILVGMTLAGCTGGKASSATHRAAASPPVTGPADSAGHPLLLSCGEESFAETVPQQPQPGDLAVGPLIIPNGKRLAAADPASSGEHGSYKVPFIVTMGSTVTVTIAAPARGHVVIDNPYAAAGVTAATYRSCSGQAGFFAQGFAFIDGRIRGCVPLEVRVGGEPQVRRVTLSLFAGSCAS